MAAVVPMVFAAPAGAANGCTGGEFPSSFAAQSGLKVACHTDPGSTANHVEIHDAPNVKWHHGGARTQALSRASGNVTTAGSATITFTAGQITAADVRRPIMAYNAALSAIFKGGTFIKAVPTATTATLSQAAALTAATPITATIEHTNNRYLDDVTCPANGVLTSASAKFTATDINKTVSGGPFGEDTIITGVGVVGTNTTATVSQPHGACTTAPPHPGDQIQVGGNTYAAGVPQVFTNDPITMQLSNTTAGGQGFTCVGSTLAMTAASKADTGGFNANYIKMSVAIDPGPAGGVVTTRKITAANVAGNTSVTLDAACPAGTANSGSFAAVGAKSAGAPANKAAMMSLGAELNLNPALVAPQDDCAAATYEGFMVIGGWTNPGISYAANTSTPPVSVGQVIFPTSVISFNGFVVPQRTGDTVAGAHYDFSFPVLPTSLAVCTTPTSHVQLTLGADPTVLAGAPFLPTGSGNVGDPSVRSLLPITGTFDMTLELLLASSPITSDTASCTIAGPTAIPGTPCGDG